VNDLLGGFAVSYVDGESPLLKENPPMVKP